MTKLTRRFTQNAKRQVLPTPKFPGGLGATSPQFYAFTSPNNPKA